MRSLALSLVLALISAGATADPVPVQTQWGASFYSGSQRMVLFSLLRDRPEGYLPLARKITGNLGLAHTNGIRLISRSVDTSPVLEYDDNINGGQPGESFQAGPFEFTVAEDEQAKSGAVLGAELSGTATLAFGDRNRAIFQAANQFAYSPDHRLGRARASASVCLDSYGGNWTWLEACATHSRQSRELSSTRRTTVTFGTSRVFESDLGVHEGNLRLRQLTTADYSKPVLGMSLKTASPSIGTVSLDLEVSAELEGHNTTTRQATAKLSRPLLGVSGSLRVTYARQEGSKFFGQDRRDDVYSLGLTRRLNNRLTVGASVTERKSSIDFYERRTLGLTVSING